MIGVLRYWICIVFDVSVCCLSADNSVFLTEG